jgi:hypothetical protein
MKSLQTAAEAEASTAATCVSDGWLEVEEVGRNPMLIPAAEAVATTATPAIRTAPTAKPATRR